MSGLSRKSCVPCREGAPALKEQEIAEYLKEIDESWKVVESKRLVREEKVKDFKQALALVNEVGEIAEEQGHHPNMSISDWNNVTFELYTHKIEGLHENDFILAAKIDEVVRDF